MYASVLFGNAPLIAPTSDECADWAARIENVMAWVTKAEFEELIGPCEFFEAMGDYLTVEPPNDTPAGLLRIAPMPSSARLGVM